MKPTERIPGYLFLVFGILNESDETVFKPIGKAHTTLILTILSCCITNVSYFLSGTAAIERLLNSAVIGSCGSI